MLFKVEGCISKRKYRLEREGDCRGFIEGWVFDKLICCYDDFVFFVCLFSRKFILCRSLV